MADALQEAEVALDAGEFPVGCIIECRGEILATGRRANTSDLVNEIDHGEMVALRHLVRNNPDVFLGDVTVYSTMEPCLMCYSTLLVNGVRNFVYAYEDVMGGGTNVPLSLLSPLYAQMKITITNNILREKSLALFKDFFSNPSNSYLQNSLLATYTLKQ